MASAHFLCELVLGKRPGEDYVVGGQGGKKGADVVLNGAGDGEAFVGVAEAGEGLEEIGNAFAKANLAGEEGLKGVLWRCVGGGELVEADAIGDDVDFFGWESHLEEGASCYGGGDGDGVGGRVDLFFADGDVGFAERLRYVPAAVLFGDDVFLIALMGGAAIANEDAAVGLDFAAGEQTGTGDGYEGVTGGDTAAGPAVEGEGVPGVHLRGDGGWVEACAVEQVVCGVNEGKGADERAGKAFALQTCPGPRGVDLLKMPFAVQLVCQFKVVIDTKDGQGDLH